MKLAPQVIQFVPLRVAICSELRDLDVLNPEGDSFFGPQSAVIEDAEEGDNRGPLGCCARTASISSLACVGLTTTRRSTSEAVLGARHLRFLIGFWSSSFSSTAYSRVRELLARLS